jgi:hypothetical protein
MGYNPTILNTISCGPANMVSAGSADEVTKIPVRLPDVFLIPAADLIMRRMITHVDTLKKHVGPTAAGVLIYLCRHGDAASGHQETAGGPFKSWTSGERLEFHGRHEAGGRCARV